MVFVNQLDTVCARRWSLQMAGEGLLPGSSRRLEHGFELSPTFLLANLQASTVKNDMANTGPVASLPIHQ